MFKPMPPHRFATADDAVAMAELVNIAGEGLPLYLWSKLTEPGVSAWEVGQERARREMGGFSFRNTVLREDGSNVVAALVGYAITDEPETKDYNELPPIIAPLQELEDMAPGTWYVNVLATYPGYRGKGYGSELLEIAEEQGRDTGKSGMSIIVSDANQGARRLYEKHGYREAATRPMVKEDWENPGENWVLLLKSL